MPTISLPPTRVLPKRKGRIVLPLRDQELDHISCGVSTITLFRGQIDVARMKAALEAALDCAPQYGGRLRSLPNRVLGCCTICFAVDINHICSNQAVDFDAGGAQIRAQPLPTGFEELFGDDDEKTWREFSTTSRQTWHTTRLFDETGGGPQTRDTHKPLTTVVVSIGAAYSVLGLCVSHVIADARSHYAFLDLLCKLYSSETQPPPPLDHYRIAHLDNAASAEYRAHMQVGGTGRCTVDPCTVATQACAMGGMLAHLCCMPCTTGSDLTPGPFGAPRKPPPVRTFTVRLTTEGQRRVKAHVAARRADAPPPRSTYDALTELFAPPPSYAPYIFSQVVDLRGRVKSVPAWEQLKTSGNAEDAVSANVTGCSAPFTHATTRRLVEEGRYNVLLHPLAAMADRNFGWNSWESVARDLFPSGGAKAPPLRGCELIAHAQTAFDPADPAFGPLGINKAMVFPADAAGSRSLRVQPVNAAHATAVKATLDELGLPYSCHDERGAVRASSDATEAAAAVLYADERERAAHDATSHACAGPGCCCVAGCTFFVLYLTLGTLMTRGACCGHLWPCYPYEWMCCLHAGSMPKHAEPSGGGRVGVAPNVESMSRSV